MNYEKLVQGILNIGEAMLQCGAEIFRVEDSLYRMYKSYGFMTYDVYVIPSNIQVTVETPEGEIITQIRHIESTGADYDKLNYLNAMSRYVCSHNPDEKELVRRFKKVMARPDQSELITGLAQITGGTAFAVFFGCDLQDAVVALIVCLMIVLVGRWLSRREGNPMIYNLILAFLSEVVIVTAVRSGLGHHPDRNCHAVSQCTWCDQRNAGCDAEELYLGFTGSDEFDARCIWYRIRYCSCNDADGKYIGGRIRCE